MRHFSTYFMATCLSSLLVCSCCQTKEEEPIPEEVTPDLCSESDNCEDGILDNLVQTWQPLGGIFEGQDLNGSCQGDLCPNIQIQLMGNASYCIEKTKVVQDSMAASLLVTQEMGTYVVKDCTCSQSGNSWDGYKIEKEGTIMFNPTADAAYQVSFYRFSYGMILDNSTKDSTFSLYLKQ